MKIKYTNNFTIETIVEKRLQKEEYLIHPLENYGDNHRLVLIDYTEKKKK